MVGLWHRSFVAVAYSGVVVELLLLYAYLLNDYFFLVFPVEHQTLWKVCKYGCFLLFNALTTEGILMKFGIAIDYGLQSKLLAEASIIYFSIFQ